MPSAFAKSPFRHRRAPGFTLVELLAVLAIVAVLILLVARIGPEFFRGRSVEASADLLRQTLSETREAAITRGRYGYLVIRTTGPGAWRRFSIFTKNRADGLWEPVSAWQSCLAPARIDDSFTIPASWTGTVGLSEMTSRITAPAAPIRDGAALLSFGTDYQAIGFLPAGRLITDENVALRLIADPGGAGPGSPILITESAMGRVKVVREE